MDAWTRDMLRAVNNCHLNNSFDSDSFFKKGNNSTWGRSIFDIAGNSSLLRREPTSPSDYLYKKYQKDNYIDMHDDSGFSENRRVISPLPSWSTSDGCGIKDGITLKDVLENDALVKFAIDKNGCHFLQANYPSEENNRLRTEVFHKLVENKDVYLNLCQNLFGNFFLQRMAECANREEQTFIVINLRDYICEFSFNKCACRVVQNAIKVLDTDLAVSLAKELASCNISSLCVDKNGNHVVQIIVDTLPMEAWAFIAEHISIDGNLVEMCENKYGCRVVQCIIEKLTLAGDEGIELFTMLMNGVVKNCLRLTASEYANYVIQHIMKADGAMVFYRDRIIETCLLGNLLSMSQEKYSSHVVEIAFKYAPDHLLKTMMTEIFEGYIPDPNSRMDALDILLFHQFGNYVIQQVISLCQTKLNDSSPKKGLEQYKKYFDEINRRVAQKKTKLSKFSSGKRILTVLNTLSPYSTNEKEEETKDDQSIQIA